MTRNKKLVKMMALAVAASTVATSVPAYAAFDATYYAQQNPDVVAAIGTKPADLETHYNVFGKKEGRAGSADEAGSALRQLFDAEYYAKLNPDVVAVYGNDANALFNHFLQFGIKEGRKINPYFDVNAYKKAYPDLVAAFGDDIAAYYNHFATNGIKEHRTLGGFPAEKIVPGGVAVASSGGSSSSSSGGGGGSSKPAPKPADTTPAEQVTPTPDPTPTPQPEPEPEPEPEPIDDRSEVAKATAEIATANDKLKADILALNNKDNIKGSEIANLVSVANVNAEKAEDNLKAATTAAEKADEALEKATDDYTAAKAAVQKITDSTLKSTALSVDQKRDALRQAEKSLATATQALETAKKTVEETKQIKEDAETAYSTAVANATSALIAAGGNAELIAATVGSDKDYLQRELNHLLQKAKGAEDLFTYKTYYGVVTGDKVNANEKEIIQAIVALKAYSKGLTTDEEKAAALKHEKTTTTVTVDGVASELEPTWKNTVDKKALLKGVDGAALDATKTSYNGKKLSELKALTGVAKTDLEKALGIDDITTLTVGDLEGKATATGEGADAIYAIADVLLQKTTLYTTKQNEFKDAVEVACKDFENIGKREEIKALRDALDCYGDIAEADTEYQKAVKAKVEADTNYNEAQAACTTAQTELSVVEGSQDRLLEGASAEDAKLVNDLESATYEMYDADDANTQAQAELVAAEDAKDDANENLRGAKALKTKTTTEKTETKSTDAYLE